MTIPRSVPPPSPAPDPGADGEERASRVMRFGAAVSAVLLSAVIATAPAAVRISPSLAGSCSAASVWTALVALAFAPLAFATVTLRHARAALRLFDPSGVPRAVAAAILWALTTLVVLAGLGAVLRATTHHHALAGVTFAFAGLFAAAVAALFTSRFVAWCSDAPPPVRWTAIAAASVATGAGLAFLARRLVHSDGGSAFIADLVAFSFGAAFGAGAFPHRSRPFAPLALAGPPIAAIAIVLGIGSLRASPVLRSAIEDEAPILAPALGLPALPAPH